MDTARRELEIAVDEGRLRRYARESDAAEAAAQHTADLLRSRLNNQRTATLVLAGGDQALRTAAALARNHADALDWSRVIALIGDERVVAANSPMSNWAALRRVLFAEALATSRMTQIPPDARGTANDRAAAYETRLREIPTTPTGAPRLDVVWLGMGPDGHTLSLFPGHPAADVESSLMTPVTASPKPPSERISLTMRAADGCANALVFATGETKRAVLPAALTGTALPVSRMSGRVAAAGGTVVWYADAES